MGFEDRLDQGHHSEGASQLMSYRHAVILPEWEVRPCGCTYGKLKRFFREGQLTLKPYSKDSVCGKYHKTAEL